MHHFYATELYALEAIFPFIHNFFEKYLIFGVFLSVPHLVDNYAKIVDERGRNLICDCTLPTFLVFLKVEFRYGFSSKPKFAIIS